MTGSFVSQDFFSLMSSSVLIGRAFLPEDFRPGSEKTIVIGYGFWQRRFGGDESVIGKQLTLNNQKYTVIGVMPQSFLYPFRAEALANIGRPSWCFNSRLFLCS